MVRSCRHAPTLEACGCLPNVDPHGALQTSHGVAVCAIFVFCCCPPLSACQEHSPLQHFNAQRCGKKRASQKNTNQETYSCCAITIAVLGKTGRVPLHCQCDLYDMVTPCWSEGGSDSAVRSVRTLQAARAPWIGHTTAKGCCETCLHVLASPRADERRTCSISALMKPCINSTSQQFQL